VVIDMEWIDPADLPIEIAISAITLAELAAGPHATTDRAERPPAGPFATGPKPRSTP
jgi:hypothetical protein